MHIEQKTTDAYVPKCWRVGNESKLDSGNGEAMDEEDKEGNGKSADDSGKLELKNDNESDKGSEIE